MQIFWAHLVEKTWQHSAAYARKYYILLCMTVGVCVHVGTHVRGSCLCDAMRNVCLPVGLSQGVPAMANAANEGAFARVCACTLKPSKCSRLRRAPSTWLKRRTSSAAIFLSPSLSHNFSFSSLSTASFLPHIGVSGFSPLQVFFFATRTHCVLVC